MLQVGITTFPSSVISLSGDYLKTTVGIKFLFELNLAFQASLNLF